jgi:hypothetical protein
MSNIVPFGELSRMAEAMARSQLFGMKTPDQVIALMLVAQANNQHPAAAARDYDIIQGRPAKKAEAMLRDFIDAGGSVKWHALDNNVADATFSHPAGGTVRIDWTMQRATEAGLAGKDMYRKWPRQMLRARVISEGVRTIYPVATGGMYTPEETQDIPGASLEVVTTGKASLPAPEMPSERMEEIRLMFDSADTMEAVQTAWTGLTKDERKAAAPFKDDAKIRLSEEAA